MSSVAEVLEKVQQLLSSLVERMHKDGRLPRTFRLTIRRFSATNKWFSRESRQCPIPIHVGQKITSGFHEEAVAQLVPLAMKLFHKMVDGSAAFHLTLLNVCFSNLQSRGAAGSRRGTITSFFTQNTSPRQTQTLSLQSQDDWSQDADSLCSDHQVDTRAAVAPLRSPFTTKGPSCSERGRSSAVVEGESRGAACGVERVGCDETTNTATSQPPLNVDLEVFQMLPEEIQKELLSPPYLSSLSRTHAPKIPRNKSSEPFKKASNGFDTSDRAAAVTRPRPAGTSVTRGQNMVEGGDPPSSSYDRGFPGNVDPGVFSELPPDVQRELMSEWKQQKLVLKIPSSVKPGRNCSGKDRRAAGNSSRSNNLFKYFKPS
ncbi:DNA polymerase iota [Austrofundulus limnaeus]|uniref:DNA polymerase iota n=1 Tax=Austrofundulus limnaeus TaxID=52670 RepID=A0A2I4CI51_AUSLI|nr:PREDICTED: DNA polymerase iota-like [Austrofundulus limnaeus]